MLKNVEKCLEMLRHIERYWKILRYVKKFIERLIDVRDTNQFWRSLDKK